MDHKDKLKQLLEAGVITPEEYNDKVNNIEINMQLKELLEAGVITQEEYDSKIDKQKSSIKGSKADFALENTVKQGNTAAVSGLAPTGYQNDVVFENNSNTTKAPIVVLGIIIAFAIGIGVGMLFSDSSSKDSAYYAVEDFYLDGAVLVLEDDDIYYHRYNCPTLPDNYSFWCYNNEAAEGEGYLPCPTCFGIDKEEYIKNNL